MAAKKAPSRIKRTYKAVVRSAKRNVRPLRDALGAYQAAGWRRVILRDRLAGVPEAAKAFARSKIRQEMETSKPKGRVVRRRRGK